MTVQVTYFATSSSSTSSGDTRVPDQLTHFADIDDAIIASWPEGHHYAVMKEPTGIRLGSITGGWSRVVMSDQTIVGFEKLRMWRQGDREYFALAGATEAGTYIAALQVVDPALRFEGERTLTLLTVAAHAFNNPDEALTIAEDLLRRFFGLHP